MHLLFRIFLYLHILGGFTALVTMIIPIASKKGGKIHKRSGEIFFWSMMQTTMAAFVISVNKSNYFLLFISVFSFYLAYAGKRIVKLKHHFYFSVLDVFIFLLSFIMCLGMLTFALIYSQLVLMVLGIIFLLMLKDSFIFFRKTEQQKKLQYLKLHLQFMLAACIATVSAFVVVNFQIQPVWILWLSPTLAGSILIAFWTIRIRKSIGIKNHKIKT